MNWIILIVAGLFETGFAFCLGKMKEATGAEYCWWGAGFLLSLALSMTLLAKATQSLPIGTAYPVWTGIGAVGTVLAGILFLNEPATFPRIFFLLLLIGGVYLVIRKVITPTIPVAYIATVAVLTFLFPMGNDNVTWMAYQLFGGGLALGAIFMATDYVTSPVTKTGQLIYGIACGLLTVFIRYFGSYPEGVSYAIIIMNCCVFLIDKIGRPKRFGLVKEAKEGGAK